MTLQSIRSRLFVLVLFFFLAVLGLITFATQKQLKSIIEKSQTELYYEKLDYILNELAQADALVNRTGMREIYLNDFQETVRENIRGKYYAREPLTDYPFIIDPDILIVLHPVMPAGRDNRIDLPWSTNFLEGREGNFTADFYGTEKWYLYKWFEPWQWIVCYTVPVEYKYRDLRKFYRIQLLNITVSFILLIPLLSAFVVRFTRPIIELTEITRKISEGDLDQKLNVRATGELAVLSRSFEAMQHSIRQKMEDLNREIIEKSQMKEQLAQAQKMDAIGQLAGGVAHDFNNVLAGIYGAAQILETYCGDNEEGLPYLKMILESTERAASLTEKLLAFGRKSHFRKERADIHRIIADSLLLLERTIDKKISLEFSPKASQSHFLGDISAIQNSIMNLTINAAHAMPEGGVLVIGTRNIVLGEGYCGESPFEIDPGPYIEVSVEDGGTGIPGEIINKIFDPFFTTKDVGKGTGLGLASVYGTIQDHQGAITVYSELNCGTVFHLYLPCSCDEERKGVDRSIAEEKPKGDSAGGGTVLLAEDERIIRETGRTFLESVGFSVFTATNGREALDIFEREKDRIDIVVTDIFMPDMGGREFFLEIRKRSPSCPVIITSGFTRLSDVELLLSRERVAYIQKPFDLRELKGLLEEMTGT